jgi:hypothetical protein
LGKREPGSIKSPSRRQYQCELALASGRHTMLRKYLVGPRKRKEGTAGPLLLEKGWAKGESSQCAIGGLEKLL